MRNKIRLYLISIIFLLTIVEVKSQEEFNFDVKEIEILEEGNLFVGKKGKNYFKQWNSNKC